MKAYFNNGTDQEIRKIFCLGLNYHDHINEMAHQRPEAPVIFLKPLTAICYDQSLVEIPSLSQNMHYEGELIIILNKGGKHLSIEQALDCVGGYGIGLDLTLRDLQAKAKEKGLPWTVAKGFDQSAPISLFTPYHHDVDLHKMNFILKVNDEIRQQADTSEMIFKIPEIISWLSDIFTLEPGDIIFTGTPSGVGQIVSGDQISVKLNTDIKLNITIK